MFLFWFFSFFGWLYYISCWQKRTYPKICVCMYVCSIRFQTHKSVNYSTQWLFDYYKSVYILLLFCCCCFMLISDSAYIFSHCDPSKLRATTTTKPKTKPKHTSNSHPNKCVYVFCFSLPQFFANVITFYKKQTYNRKQTHHFEMYFITCNNNKRMKNISFVLSFYFLYTHSHMHTFTLMWLQCTGTR